MTISHWAYTNITNIMHREICGCDNWDCALIGEIYDWLADGKQIVPAPTIAERLVEWRNYVNHTGRGK